MKKSNLITSAAAILLVAGLFVSGCKKDDTAAPLITLSGSTSITQSLPNTAGAGTWTDPGFSASDNEDGDLTSSVAVSGTVNPNKKGTYTITYSVNDAAGNNSSATRTVNIVNNAEYLAGNYLHSVDSCTLTSPSAFDATVVTSDSTNNKFYITNFGAFDSTGAIKIWATVSGSSIAVPINQSLGGTAYIQQFYSASSGVITISGSTVMKIKYQWNDGASSDICTSYYIR